MELNSQLILASKNAVTGANLYTFVLTYPRCILSEINTHRVLSRNTASSRAIPSKKQRANILDNPFIPMSIGANQKGMQAGEELSGWRRNAIETIIRALRYPNVAAVWAMDKLGAHKQVVNRYLEPWMWVQQVMTATDWKNVFKLRNHKDAEPHFHALAEIMQRQIDYVELLPADVWKRRLTNATLSIGTVQMLYPGAWHLPFITDEDIKEVAAQDRSASSFKWSPSSPNWEKLKQVSTARCARVSYYLPESGSRSDLKRDIELCSRLSSSGHWSPFEHVATPVEAFEYIGNFLSWKQYRKEFDAEAGGDRVLVPYDYRISTPQI